MSVNWTMRRQGPMPSDIFGDDGSRRFFDCHSSWQCGNEDMADKEPLITQPRIDSAFEISMPLSDRNIINEFDIRARA